MAKVYNIPFPKDFRDKQKREEIAKMAAKIKVDPFSPSDKLAKQMANEVDKDENKEQVEKQEIQAEEMTQKDEEDNQTTLFNKFIELIKNIKNDG